MVYGDYKYLNRKTAADEVLHDKAFNIAKNPNLTDINLGLLQWFMIFLIKKLLVAVLKMKIFLIKN